MIHTKRKSHGVPMGLLFPLNVIGPSVYITAFSFVFLGDSYVYKHMCLCIHMYLVLFLWLFSSLCFVLSYLIYYYYLDAYLFYNKKQKWHEFQWKRKWGKSEKLGKVKLMKINCVNNICFQ